MAEELEYTSKYDGKTSDAIMDYSNKLRQQTSATDADTVQVFDTSGNPHKISKTELALPSLNDISAFVAVNQAGNAIGLMTKQQVATVLGGLITKKERLGSSVDWDTLTENGMYYTSGYNTSYANTPPGAHLYGILLVFVPIPNAVLQIYTPDGGNPHIYVRVHNNNWTAWRKHEGVNI